MWIIWTNLTEEGNGMAISTQSLSNKPYINRHLRTACISATKQSCQLAAAQGLESRFSAAQSTCSAPQPIDSFVWLPKCPRFGDVDMAYYQLRNMSSLHWMSSHLV